jgi:hypothetical protein
MDPPRIHLRPLFVVMAMGCFVLFLGGPLAVAVIVSIFAPLNVSMYIAPGAVVFFAVMAWAMSSSVQWGELDNGVIRARKLLTRKIVVHRVADIVAVKPLNSNAMGRWRTLWRMRSWAPRTGATSCGSVTGRSWGWSGATWPGWMSF